jgi:hypothetical protein
VEAVTLGVRRRGWMLDTVGYVFAGIAAFAMIVAMGWKPR